jgi:prefoldin subunit 1
MARFVQAPSQEVMDRLASETQAQAKEKENLDKKMHYLETTYKNSRDNFEQILKNAGGSV